MGSKIDRKSYVNGSYIISSLGFGIEDNCKAILNQEVNSQLWNNQLPLCAIDKDILEQKVSRYGLASFTKVQQLSIIAIEELFEGDRDVLGSDKTLFILSTTKGDIDLIKTDIDSCFLFNTAKTVADYFEMKNKPVVVSNACISGVSSIIIAADFVRNGDYDNVLVVGVDVLSEFVIKGFNSFKSVSQNMCRPYDAQRDGLTIGEACGAILISSEENDSAVEVAYGAISNDANHISGPSRTGDGLALAIEKAMTGANVTSSEIGFINAHGTATSFNDEMESKAMNLMGLNDAPLNSLKSYIGHTLGASGVVESILCCEQLKRNVVYGVKGFENLGVPHLLNISAKNRGLEVDCALKTASGFGGCNAAVILKKVSSDLLSDLPSEELKQKVESEVVSAIKIEKKDVDSFSEYVRSQFKSLGDGNIKFYKMDNLSKLGYIASLELLNGFTFDCRPSEIALVLSNRSSSLDSDLRHQNSIDILPIEEISPTIFVYTLANIVTGEIAIKHKIQGETTFFIDDSYNASFMKKYSENLLQKGVKYVIYGWCEYLNDEFSAEMIMIKNRY